MTDQNNTTTVETSQTNPKASLEQWQHLPIYQTKDRVKPLAVLRYGDTTVRLGWPIVDYLLSAWDEGTKNGPDRSALLGHNFVYQETKSHGFYSSYFHQRISS